MRGNCPDCGAPLTGPHLAAAQGNRYEQYWTCPNYEKHGTLVLCSHGCGKEVSYSRLHFYSQPGVIGGRWTCIPQETEDFARWFGEGGMKLDPL